MSNFLKTSNIGKFMKDFPFVRVIVVILLIFLCLYYTKTQENDVDSNITTRTFKTTNYMYEKEYTQQDFEAFLRGENTTLIVGYPELLYDDTILLGIFETKYFYRTENAYYLLTYQPTPNYVMYRFQQVDDDIVGYIKYNQVRS